MFTKKYYSLILLVGIISMGFVLPQNDVISKVRDAIKTGSSKEISQLLNQTVDMTIQGTMKNYSKAQAEIVLKDFFKKYPPSSFTIKHQGSSKGGLLYAIGVYISDSSSFDVWIRVKKFGDSYLIQEVSFTKSKI